MRSRSRERAGVEASLHGLSFGYPPGGGGRRGGSRPAVRCHRRNACPRCGVKKGVPADRHRSDSALKQDFATDACMFARRSFVSSEFASRPGRGAGRQKDVIDVKDLAVLPRVVHRRAENLSHVELNRAESRAWGQVRSSPQHATLLVVFETPAPPPASPRRTEKAFDEDAIAN